MAFHTDISSIAVGDAVHVRLPSGAEDGPYRVEVAAKGNRFKCRRLKDGRLTRKLPAAQLVKKPPPPPVAAAPSVNTNRRGGERQVPPPAGDATEVTGHDTTAGRAQAPPSALTRLSWAQLSSPGSSGGGGGGGRALLVDALRRDSLFVLTDLGARFEKAYAAYLASAKAFFLRAPTAEKRRCISREVYRNERRTPMWFCGYESTDIRECFRVPGGTNTDGDEFIQHWPCAESKGGGGSRDGGSGGDGGAGGGGGGGGGGPAEEDGEGAVKAKKGEEDGDEVARGRLLRLRFQAQWLKLTRLLQAICDRCLKLLLGPNARSASSTEDDLSVSYTFHYHNAARGSGSGCRSSTDAVEVSDQEQSGHAVAIASAGNGCCGDNDDDMVVTEHCDPSLFVVEPCSEVGGLEVYLRSAGAWSEAEALCVPGKEVVVFCGKALQAATERCARPQAKQQQRGATSCPWLPAGGIPATPHRVRFRGGPAFRDHHRFCVIFEQKYVEFYPQ